MKILHLLPSLSSGGVEQVVLELCEGLEARGIENCVISAGGPMVESIEATGARHIQRPVGKKNLRSVYEAFWLRKLLRKERFDILHLHSRVPAWVGYLAVKGLKPEQRPALVTSFHGFHSVNQYSAIMAKGERVIAVSESMKQHILDNYPACPSEKIRVIPNSVDTDLFDPSYSPSEAWLKEWHSSFPELEGRYTLCLPGRITRIKGAEQLPEILTGLHRAGIPAHAVIVGETKKGKEKYKEKLLQLFRDAKLESYTTWTGHRRDLRDLLCACDVTLSLTLQPESFGKTTLEALSLGRPVAGYEHGGVGEQLDRFLPEGKIPVNDIPKLVEVLTRWHNCPPTPSSPVPEAYQRDTMIAAHIAVYQELLG